MLSMAIEEIHSRRGFLNGNIIINEEKALETVKTLNDVKRDVVMRRGFMQYQLNLFKDIMVGPMNSMKKIQMMHALGESLL
jgi:hypothetical protein